MNEEIKKLLSNWIGVNPESGHPLDNERLYDLVLSCIKNGVNIDRDIIYSEIKKQKEWSEEFAIDFIEENSIIISHIIGFMDYLKEKHHIGVSPTLPLKTTLRD